MVGSYSYFFLNCTAENMVVCLERRGKIFYCEKLQPGEAARVRSKAAGRFAFTVCCRIDRAAPPHLGDSFRNYWGEHREPTTPLSTSSINLEPAAAAARGGATNIDRQPTSACSSTTSVGRECAEPSTASSDREPAPARSMGSIVEELLVASIINKNAKRNRGAAGGVGRPAASSALPFGTKENSDDGTGVSETRRGARGDNRPSFPDTREGDGGRARRRGDSRSSCAGIREAGERGRGRGGSGRSSSRSGGGGLAGSRAVVAASEAGVVKEPASVRVHAEPHHQPRHYKYRRPDFFAMCNTFCAFSGGGAEAISLHDLNEKVFRSYEPIIRRGEL